MSKNTKVLKAEYVGKTLPPNRKLVTLGPNNLKTLTQVHELIKDKSNVVRIRVTAKTFGLAFQLVGIGLKYTSRQAGFFMLATASRDLPFKYDSRKVRESTYRLRVSVPRGCKFSFFDSNFPRKKLTLSKDGKSVLPSEESMVILRQDKRCSNLCPLDMLTFYGFDIRAYTHFSLRDIVYLYVARVEPMLCSNENDWEKVRRLMLGKPRQRPLKNPYRVTGQCR